VIVNFGCGANPAPSTSGYINIDGSLTVLLARLPLPSSAFRSRADFIRVLRANHIRYGTASHLRFPECSLDGFYASHVLEHLSKHDCENLLFRVHKWLKPSGVLRVALPDLRRFARAYLEGATDASQFVAATNFAPDGRSWWEMLFGHSQHRWMYDAASFSRLLADLGFREIKEYEMNQGRLPALSCLDIPSRQAESFYIEAGY
jgi:hypothetical protein